MARKPFQLSEPKLLQWVDSTFHGEEFLGYWTYHQGDTAVAVAPTRSR